jgi:hypothetical protein
MKWERTKTPQANAFSFNETNFLKIPKAHAIQTRNLRIFRRILIGNNGTSSESIVRGREYAVLAIQRHGTSMGIRHNRIEDSPEMI